MLSSLSGFLLALLLSRASAQTLATCFKSAGYSWSFNSLDQSPCEVATSLGTQCRADFGIQALPTGFGYTGMNLPFANECVCNTVYYSLLSVCGLCQGGDILEYPVWSGNCTADSGARNEYPRELPSGLRVPHFAFLPLSPTTNKIDLAAALSDNASDVTSKPSKKTVPIGAIVGGIIGGIVFIAFVVGAVIFCIRKNRQTVSNTYSQTPHGGYNSGPSPPLTSQMTNPGPQIIYNPNNPGSSPFSPAPSATTSQPSSLGGADSSRSASTAPFSHVPPGIGYDQSGSQLIQAGYKANDGYTQTPPLQTHTNPNPGAVRSGYAGVPEL